MKNKVLAQVIDSIVDHVHAEDMGGEELSEWNELTIHLDNLLEMYEDE